MHRRRKPGSKICPAVLLALLASGSALAVKPDKAGCADHTLFPTRMPNYCIAHCEVKEFPVFQLKLPKAKTRTVEGKLTQIHYGIDDRKDEQSGLAVVRNYENAPKRIGGKVAESDP